MKGHRKDIFKVVECEGLKLRYYILKKCIDLKKCSWKIPPIPIACVPQDWDPSEAEAWNKVMGLLVKTHPPLWMLLSFAWMTTHGYEELRRGDSLGGEIKGGR